MHEVHDMNDSCVRGSNLYCMPMINQCMLLLLCLDAGGQENAYTVANMHTVM